MSKMKKDDVLRVAGACFDDKALSTITYSSGPYEITEPTVGLSMFAAAMYAAGAEDMRERAEGACRDRAKGLLSIIDLPVCQSAIIQRDRARQWDEAAELVSALPITPTNTEGKQ